MISTCQTCHKLYDFVSEEAANEPGRECGPCYRERLRRLETDLPKGKIAAESAARFSALGADSPSIDRPAGRVTC